MASQLIIKHLQTYGALLVGMRLLTGIVGAWTTYRLEPGADHERTFMGFVRYCLPAKIWTMQSVRFDVYFFLLGRFSSVWLFAVAAAAAAAAVSVVYGAMTALFGAHAQNAASWPLQVALVAAYLGLRDFGEFASHALMHRSAFLWEFHKVHHSSLLLTPLGSKRAHVVEDAIRIIPNAVVIAGLIGFLSYLFSLQPQENMVLGVMAYGLFNILSFEVLRHSHIPLSFGYVERYVMSPLQHHVHHNREGEPRNFGSFLACWDRAFGTFSMSVPRGSFEIGLHPAEQAKYSSFATLCLKPIADSARIVWLSGQPARLHAKRCLARDGATQLAKEREVAPANAVGDRLSGGLPAAG